MKGTIEVLVGISGSGKSSYAHEQWMIDPNVVIVNRDKIRELLYGFTESRLRGYMSSWPTKVCYRTVPTRNIIRSCFFSIHWGRSLMI